MALQVRLGRPPTLNEVREATGISTREKARAALRQVQRKALEMGAIVSGWDGLQMPVEEPEDEGIASSDLPWPELVAEAKRLGIDPKSVQNEIDLRERVAQEQAKEAPDARPWSEIKAEAKKLGLKISGGRQTMERKIRVARQLAREGGQRPPEIAPETQKDVEPTVEPTTPIEPESGPIEPEKDTRSVDERVAEIHQVIETLEKNEARISRLRNIDRIEAMGRAIEEGTRRRNDLIVSLIQDDLPDGEYSLTSIASRYRVSPAYLASLLRAAGMVQTRMDGRQEMWRKGEAPPVVEEEAPVEDVPVVDEEVVDEEVVDEPSPVEAEPEGPPPVSDSAAVQEVILALPAGTYERNELFRLTNATHGALATALLRLEMAGKISKTSGDRFVLSGKVDPTGGQAPDEPVDSSTEPVDESTSPTSDNGKNKGKKPTPFVTPEEKEHPESLAPERLVEVVEATGRLSRDRDMLFQKLGIARVPGLRPQELVEAGRLAYLVAKGEVSQEEFDAQVEQWRQEGRISKPKSKGKKPEPKVVEDPTKPPELPEGVVLGRETKILAAGMEPMRAWYVLAPITFGTMLPNEGEGANPRGSYAPGTKNHANADRLSREKQSDWWLTDHPAPTDGPSTVTADDRLVQNGNARKLALDLALERDGNIDWYIEPMIEAAPKFGIDSTVAREKQGEGGVPWVVWRVVHPMDADVAAEFAAAGNESATAGQSPVRRAASLRHLIDFDLIDSVRMDDDTTFSEAVKTGASAREFRERIRGALPVSVAPTFFEDDGASTLTDAGVELIRYMMLAEVLPVEVIEEFDMKRRGWMRSVEGVVPQLMQIIKLNPEANLAPQLIEAIQYAIQNDIRNEGDLKQAALPGFEPYISPGAKMLLDFVARDGLKPRIFRGHIVSIVSALSDSLIPFDNSEIAEVVARALEVTPQMDARFGLLNNPVEGFEDVDDDGAPSGPAFAARYGGDLPAIGTNASAAATVPVEDRRVFGLRELVELAQLINDGKIPNVLERLRGRAIGLLRIKKDKADIHLQADLMKGIPIRSGLVHPSKVQSVINRMLDEIIKDTGLSPNDITWGKVRGRGGKVLVTFYRKDPTYAARVLAHEIGHLIDWLDDRMITRGNILGRVASLRKYMHEMLQNTPDNPESLISDEERTKLRNEAEKQVRREGYKRKDDSELFNRKVRERYADLLEEERQARGLITRQEVENELKKLTQWWNPFDTNEDPRYTEYRFSSEELYAEALSVLLNNPGAMVDRAPIFSAAWAAWLEAKPHVKEVYDGLDRDIRSGEFESTAVQNLRDGWKRGDARRLAAARADKARSRSAFSQLWNYFMVDVASALKHAARQAGNTRVREMLEEAVYSGSEQELYHGRFANEVGKLLQENNLDTDDLREYLFHQRVLEDRSELFNPRGWTPDSSSKRLAEIESNLGADKWAVMLQAHEAFWQIRKSLFVEKARAAGIYNEELMKKLEDNKYYVKFSVVDYISEHYGTAQGARIHRQIGTLKDVGDPIAETIQHDLSLMVSINWNNAKRAAIDFMNEHMPESIQPATFKNNGRFREFDESPDPDKSLVLIMVDGKMQGYWMDAPFAVALERPNRGRYMMLGYRLLRLSADPFRILFVGVRPGFWLYNMVRDLKRGMIYLPGSGALGGRLLRAWFKAIKPAFKSAWGIDEKHVQRMMQKNMLISVANYNEATSEETNLDRMQAMWGQKEEAWNANVVSPFKKLFHLGLRVGQGIERIPKIAAYDMLLASGMDESEIGYYVRNLAGSPSFLTRGAWTPVTNNLLLFSNAMIQGWRSNIEAMRERPGEVLPKMLIGSMLPKALMVSLATGMMSKLLRAAGGDDDDSVVRWAEAMDKMYRGVSEYMKTNYTIIPLGIDSEGKTVFLSIPQEETQRFIGGLYWKMANLPTRGPKALLQSLDYTAGQVPTWNPIFKLTSAAVEYVVGRNPYDYFRQRYVVPEQVFRAGGAESHKAMGQWMWNESGLSLVYRFEHDNTEKIRGEIEQIVRVPGVNDTLGRFLRVSDYGNKELLQEVMDAEEQTRARQNQELTKLLDRKLAGENLTAAEQQTLRENQQYVRSREPRLSARRNSDPYAEALLRAPSRAAKDALQLKILEMEGPDFDLIPYIEGDIRRLGTTLAGVPPVKARERLAHNQERREILKWMRERHISQGEVLRLMRPEINKLQTERGREAKRTRLLHALKGL